MLIILKHYQSISFDRMNKNELSFASKNFKYLNAIFFRFSNWTLRL